MTTKKTQRNPKQRSAEPIPGPTFDRRLMERQMAAVTRLLEGHDFGSIEEANAFLEQVMTSGDLPPAQPSTPLEEAQDIIYQALEARGKRREQLARRALSISPDCADAYVLLAEATAEPQKARRLYEQGVQAGERALGDETFKEDAGHFWGMIETRPYMRARQGLAQVLWHLGEREAAIAHARDMLRLNPGDNQGIRYVLANWLLAVRDNAALDQLLAQYPDEWSAQWAYTVLLQTFRSAGPGRQADQALQHALEVNRHVPLYLLGIKSFPKQMPGYYGMGDENEAVLYVAEAAEPWLATPGASEWLAKAMIRLATSSMTPPPARTRKPRRKS